MALAAPAQDGQYPIYLLFAAVQYLLFYDSSHPLADYYGSLRREALPPDTAFPCFRGFCLDYAPAISELVATRLVQTNEVGRTACLAPALAYISGLAGGKPLSVIDVGTSGGLNLLFDRYRIDYGRFIWGDPSSPAHVRCELQGDVDPPLKDWRPNIAQRVGIDLAPVDVAALAEARWLRALVWPDHKERAELLNAAMAIAASQPPRLLKGDAVDLLPDVFAAIPPEQAPVVFQSYSLEYFWPESREKFSAILEEVGASRDLYFVQMYGIGDAANLRLTYWRNGATETVELARCQPHGQWLRWN